MNDNYDLTEIHIRWNNGEDLVLTVSYKDSISDIKQLVNRKIYSVYMTIYSHFIMLDSKKCS
jgi:hypothetical protein